MFITITIVMIVPLSVKLTRLGPRYKVNSMYIPTRHPLGVPYNIVGLTL